MADSSAIEWTDATWNPATGCDKVSPGCKNCYADVLAKRLNKMGQRKYKNGFEYTEHPDALDLPAKWKKPKRIFVNSMSDLFHEKATADFIDKVWVVMHEADHHTYQVLTKRPQSMADYTRVNPAPPNVWLGTSVENADYVHRIDALRKTDCTTRFVSFEPLIGPVGEVDLSGIAWAIIGGESGRYHRPVEADWIRDLIRQCREQHVAVFFKQWGGEYPKAGGAEIDGKEYREFPPTKQRYKELPKSGQATL